MQIRQGKDKLSADTLKKYEDALEVREITIKDLNARLIKKDEEHAAEIKAMQTRHASEIQDLQSQITGLQAQITALTSKNKVLEDSVTGKVYLEKILEMLSAFAPLIAKDGMLQEFLSAHKRHDDDLSDIKNHLKISNRHEDNGTTPAGN